MTAIKELIEYCKQPELQALLNVGNSPICKELNCILKKAETELKNSGWIPLYKDGELIRENLPEMRKRFLVYVKGFIHPIVATLQDFWDGQPNAKCFWVDDGCMPYELEDVLAYRPLPELPEALNG